ncbi:MFS transporter [Edaphobacillus lindanitolerans]|uniref:Predicted arabinose efflux permease, MFS family n=1 Tax=Edaphobacillus lindanitolerans TaxID=550447 RepID=A0A1U7PPG3_9BACI|nr:MFS transporter [Edaphobacillus lindanitolerans]SIT88313.1 Predicted arabinose efflux permease, MFS family [Edaphobacillus lindanitolerans]
MWKKYGLLLGGIGVSNFGNWVYLVALNLLVLEMTGSAAAVAGLYIIGPAARILTNLFAGSVIDRSDKKQMMIGSDVLRGLLVLLMPFAGSIWLVYALVFCTNAVGAFFGPSSTFVITKLVPDGERQRFNSFMGMMNSGAFVLGPATAGVLILAFGTTWSIFLNAATFLVCALCIALLPSVTDERDGKIGGRFGWRMIRDDFFAVHRFTRAEPFFFRIYLLFQVTLMVAFALDSQEVTFLKQDLSLDDRQYGVIVSIAGVGSLIGASLAATFAKKVSLQMYIAGGMVMTMAGYTAFYSSAGFWTATAAFIVLGVFMAFSNAGYETFYQRRVPTALMGRFGSLAAIFQSALQILFTLVLGITAEWFTVQGAAIGFSLLAVLLSGVLAMAVMDRRKSGYFRAGHA